MDETQFERVLELQRIKAEMADLFEETEQKMAEHAAWREDMRAHGLYREDLEAPPQHVEPPQTRQNPEPVMHYRRMENALAPAPAPPDEGPFTAAQHDVLAAVISELRAEWHAAIEEKVDELRRAATRTDVDELRCEVARLRESIAGRVTILAPTKGKTDAA
jgi:hypothetical protein